MKATVCILFVCLIIFSAAVNGANRYWVATVPGNWNNTANWSTTSGGVGGASVPGVADAVLFNSLGIGNCTINAPVSVVSINVNALYTGNIIQGVQTIATSSTAIFNGGIFTGGSANITFGAACTINGAVFISTSATLEFNANSTFSAGSFVHNNGSVRYNYTGAGSLTIGGTGTYILNNLEFAGTGHTYNLPTANVSVSGALNFTGSSFYNISSGTIDAAGDINLNNTAAGCMGTAVINIMGSGTQNINGGIAAGIGALPKVTINKSAGTLNLNNFITFSSHFTYTAGSVNEGTSTVCFVDGSQSPNNITGSLTFNNIQFVASANQVFKLAAATTLTVNGDIILGGAANLTLNTGNINVKGNMYLTNTSGGGGGTSIINMTGTGNQVIDASSIAASQSILPFLIINKSSGTLTLKGIISVSQDWTYTSGTVDATTWASTVLFGGNNLNIKGAGMNFYNLTVTANTSTLTSSLAVNNDLTINGTGILAAGANTINLGGSWINSGTAGFTESTSTVNFNGSGLQSITSPGGENFTNMIINNSSTGIRLNNNITIATSLNMTQGNINLNGNTLNLGISVAANGTLSRTSGTMFGAGSFTRWLKVLTIADGAISGLFPLGTAADYRPFYISAPTTAPGTGGTISVGYTDAATNTSTSFTDGAFTVLLRKDLNWAVTPANGLAGGTYNLRAEGTGFGTVASVSDLRITLVNSVVGTAGVNAGTVSNPQINRTGLSFANLTNTFYVGTINPSNSTLPITFLSFSAIAENEKVKLDWKITANMNSGYFTIQRSEDGLQWESIQKIVALAGQETFAQYTAYDEHPYNSSHALYRVMKANLDGSVSYTSVIAIRLANISSLIKIYPNPANEHITVTVSIKGDYHVSVINAHGQLVLNSIMRNSNNVNLNVQYLKSGLYFIVIKNKMLSETLLVAIRTGLRRP